MSKVSVINVLIGWIGLVISAFAGVFIASDLSTEFINHSQMSETWKSVIIQSSHGHSNMFSMIHILFGLSLSLFKFIQIVRKSFRLYFFLWE